jgi:hypothetical protein
MLDLCEPVLFRSESIDALLSILDKAEHSGTLTDDERIEIAILRFITLRAQWRMRSNLQSFQGEVL